MIKTSQNIAGFIPTLTIKYEEFQEVRKVIHDYCGIYINEGKEALVQSRLMKRIRKLGLASFRDYLDFIHSDSGEFLAFIDVLTTNKTNFFREADHFDFLRSEVLPHLNEREVKWWSAGCSTGEEPITCAITLLEAQQKAKILATDISREVLKTAKEAKYSESKMAGISGSVLNKYFEEEDGVFTPIKKVRDMITYGRLNLKEGWPMKGPFHMIMCRNVMIYFNRETQYELISRFQQLLEPNGYLFLGHSEGIPKEVKGFKNVAPAVYQKK